MVKTMTNGQIRDLGFFLAAKWESNKNEIQISGKNLFYMLKIKQQIEEKTRLINQAFMAVGERFGGTVNEQGNLQIPQENIPTVNTELESVAAQEDNIEYTPIVLKDEEKLPVEIMEAFLPFIELE